MARSCAASAKISIQSSGQIADDRRTVQLSEPATASLNKPLTEIERLHAILLVDATFTRNSTCVAEGYQLQEVTAARASGLSTESLHALLDDPSVPANGPSPVSNNRPKVAEG